jgi:mono/diheme cytochrome c family protein
MKKAYLVVGAIAVCVLLPLGVIFFGLVNVAASNPENTMVEWLLSTTMKRSVSARAGGFDPPDLTDTLRIQEGLSLYARMCVDCHGAPGVKQSGFIKGLNPPAPILAEEVHEWDSRELFWITKHGVKMTGMPAFGHARSDEEIWAMVAFLQRMPTMSPEQYATELQEAGPHRPGSRRSRTRQ